MAIDFDGVEQDFNPDKELTEENLEVIHRDPYSIFRKGLVGHWPLAEVKDISGSHNHGAFYLVGTWNYELSEEEVCRIYLDGRGGYG